MLLACLLPSHLQAQDDLALAPASLDRSPPSRPKSSLLLNTLKVSVAEVKHPDRNKTDEECPVCGTNGTETTKNCCAPGGTWHGTCAAREHEAEHTFQEGFHACHCENNVVCRLRRDLDRAVTQLDTAKKHQLEAMVRKDRNARLNNIASHRDTSTAVHHELNHTTSVPQPERKLYIGRFGSGATDQWCQKNCMEIAGLCPNDKCADNTHEEQPDVVASRTKPRMSALEPTPESATDVLARELLRNNGSALDRRARERVSSTNDLEDVNVRGSVPDDKIYSPFPEDEAPYFGKTRQNQPAGNPDGSQSRKRREPEAARSTKHSAPSAQRPAPSTPHPAPSAQHPAPSAQLPAPSAQRPAPSAQHPAPSVQRPSSGNSPSAVTPRADITMQRASMTDELKPVGMSHCGNTGPIKVAVLIAMDIRLPKGEGHCKFAGDITCDSREDVLKLFNGITKGSDVFVATDRAFKNDVHNDLHHVSAVRYSEDVGGGMPKNMPGQMRQWWRLKQAWGLLEEFEAKCKHTYYWVFKIRTDAIVLGGSDLHTLAMKFDAKVGASRLLTYSDRWFGGRRDAMARMATLFDNYNRYKGIFGTCGGCELVATLLHEIHSSPKSTQMPLPGKVMARQHSSHQHGGAGSGSQPPEGPVCPRGPPTCSRLPSAPERRGAPAACVCVPKRGGGGAQSSPLQSAPAPFRCR